MRSGWKPNWLGLSEILQAKMYMKESGVIYGGGGVGRAALKSGKKALNEIMKKN